MKKFYSSTTSFWSKCSYLKQGSIVFIFALGFFSAVNSVQAQPYGSLGWCSAAPCNGTLSVTRPGKSCSPGSGPATNCPAALACRPTDSIWSSGLFPCGQCAPVYSGSAIYAWEGNVTCDSGGTSSGSTSARCGSAAKSYAYTDTAYSGLLCGTGSSPTVGNNNVPFPAPGATVTWTCFNSSSPSVNCSASRASAPSITCGPDSGQTFPSSGPASNRLCVQNGSPYPATGFGARYSGSYWTGWSWTCGTSSCSANLAPGVCGSANGTTRSSAPSTPTELCQAGSASGVSGSGPWTWSCSGTSCSANKTATCTPNCPNPALYCTTTPIYDSNCGTYCGNGTTNCSTPRLIVCPASASLSPGGTVQLNARYWSNLASVPSCSTTGYSTVTTSSTWSSLNTSVATVNNVSPKGLVTAGSPVVTSLANIRAIYSGRQAIGGVTVAPVSSGPTGVINATSCTIPLNSSSCTSTVSWSSSNFVGSASARQNGTSFSSSGSNAGTSRSVSFSNNTFTLVDTGSAFTASATASVSCASGVWDGSKCAAATCLCDPSEDASQCVGGYTNSCGASCTGTKDCSQPWVEVRP